MKLVFFVVLTGVASAAVTALLIILLRPPCENDGNGPKPQPPAPPRERYRPYFHYTPSRNWLNDPNGLVYYKGEYHLFGQYNPEGINHGNLSWTHAVSTDMVHWEELPMALAYEDNGWIFSGAAVVDVNNTSDLGSVSNPPFIAMYTNFHPETKIQSQHLAVSFDLGRTFKKYKNNPVLDINEKEFRDPKVHWDGRQWIVALVWNRDPSPAPKAANVRFYSSPDLLKWTLLSQFPETGSAGAMGGVWECPDMFELPVDGDPHNKKWVLIVNINPGGPMGGSSGQYFLGTWDGVKFVADDLTERWLDWGKDFYAGITWESAPDNKRILIAWMSNWNYAKEVPTTPWRHGYSVPRELALKTIPGRGVTLVQEPVDTLTSLRDGPVQEANRLKIDSEEKLFAKGKAVDIDVTFTPGTAQEFGLKVYVGDNQETVIGYDVTKKRVFVNRVKSGDTAFAEDFSGEHGTGDIELHNGQLRLRVLVDMGSVEVFVNQGEVSITDTIFPDEHKDNIKLYAKGGSVEVRDIALWKMKSYK